MCGGGLGCGAVTMAALMGFDGAGTLCAVFTILFLAIGGWVVVAAAVAPPATAPAVVTDPYIAEC